MEGAAREGRSIDRSVEDRWTPRWGWFCFFGFVFLFFVLMGVRCGSLWVVCLSLCRYVGSVVDDGANGVQYEDGRSVGRTVGRSWAVGRRRVASGRVGRFFRVARLATTARARGEARTSECERTNRDPTVMSHQDWKEITIGKRLQSGGGGGSMKAAKVPRRSPRRFAGARR